MNEVQMQTLSGIASSLQKVEDGDNDSLPDITLYPFEPINDTVKVAVNVFYYKVEYQC